MGEKSWRKRKSVEDGHVIQVARPKGNVLRRRESGELSEVVREVSLIEEAALDCHVRQIDLALGSNPGDGTLEPLDLGVRFRGEPNFLSEKVREAATAIADARRHIGHFQPWDLELPQRISHFWPTIQRLLGCRDEALGEDIEPRFKIGALEKAIPQVGRPRSPNILEAHHLVSEPFRGEAEKRKRSSRPKVCGNQSFLARIVDKEGSRVRPAEDGKRMGIREYDDELDRSRREESLLLPCGNHAARPVPEEGNEIR